MSYCGTGLSAYDSWLTTEPQGKPAKDAKAESCFYCDGHGGEFVGGGYGEDVWEACSHCKGTGQIEE